MALERVPFRAVPWTQWVPVAIVLTVLIVATHSISSWSPRTPEHRIVQQMRDMVAPYVEESAEWPQANGLEFVRAVAGDRSLTGRWAGRRNADPEFRLPARGQSQSPVIAYVAPHLGVFVAYADGTHGLFSWTRLYVGRPEDVRFGEHASHPMLTDLSDR